MSLEIYFQHLRSGVGADQIHLVPDCAKCGAAGRNPNNVSSAFLLSAQSSFSFRSTSSSQRSDHRSWSDENSSYDDLQTTLPPSAPRRIGSLEAPPAAPAEVPDESSIAPVCHRFHEEGSFGSSRHGSYNVEAPPMGIGKKLLPPPFPIRQKSR